MDAPIMIVRLIVGLLFAAHGAQKLFGWFGGGGLIGTTQAFRDLGYPKPRAMTFLAGASELFGGLMLLSGLLFPLACAAIIGLMLNAIVAAHARNGLWSHNGGFEYPLVLVAVATSLAFTGPGAPSLDDAMGIDISGGDAAAIAIALGFCGGMAVLLSRRPRPTTVKQELSRTHKIRIRKERRAA